MSLNRIKLMQKKKQIIHNEVKKIENESNKRLTEQMAEFTKNLESFASKYKNEIQFNPEFREKFYTMCIEIGIDPLASVSLFSKNI